MREFIREIGGPIALAELLVLISVVCVALFYAGLAIGDI
jgi:hypothetical protein